MGSLVVLLLAERARSEGARSTRAFEDRPGYPVKREASEVGGRVQEYASLDARSEGQSGDSLRRESVTSQRREQKVLGG